MDYFTDFGDALATFYSYGFGRMPVSTGAHDYYMSCNVIDRQLLDSAYDEGWLDKDGCY